MKTFRRIALALAIIGAINWGLIGLFRFDLVAAIFGGQTAGLSRLIYTLVGLSGLICLSYFFDDNTGETARNRGTDQQGRANAKAQPNYGTEFAEEPDLDKLYNPSREAYEKNKDES
ncbi:DUF378 domain-containing protein [Siminovitchia sp. 179-K 8D1 HS]|uniref:DUF378 domain-containing protein n=1 Tax=Siminovitchia sp. 179-K 8D1 HS TaxID=3142385 RepID=UPI0039A1C25C